MPRLALLLRDLHLPRAPEPGEDAARLGALEYWLAAGTARAVPGGWRGWLAQAVLGTGLSEADGGAGLTASTLLATGAGRYFWFATPVHYVAGLDTLHLPASGLLTLAAAEQQALAADFARVFQAAPWRLHVTGHRDLLLEGPDPGRHVTQDPALVAGGDLAAAQPRGADVRALRQLATEIEMWLFEHPLNRERERLGALPVTGLWPWGGGASGAVTPLVGTPPQLHGEDAYTAALAAARGAVLRALPASAGSLAAAGSDVAVVVSGACTAGHSDLLRLEQHWFAPLVAQLAAGRWSMLTLLAGAHSHELRRGHRWRLWRRPRAWWQAFG
ncbi:MAG: hypothetical protein IT480_02600 [Gammaproteobacteria bacterium]|nr:hypothetical protein [Gammaproteobacteria bacterium]